MSDTPNKSDNVLTSENVKPSGAVMQPQYMGRTIETYPISASEVAVITSFNAQSTIYFSVAAALAGYAISVWTNALFYASLTPAGTLAVKVAAPLLLVLALIFTGLGALNVVLRGGVWRQIKGESSPVSKN